MATITDTDDGNTITVPNDPTNTVYGGGGADIINGGTGHDTLYGGDGNDVISGNDGNDTLYGDAGDDILNGGASGNERLIGGAGNDTITGSGVVIDGGEGDDNIDVRAVANGTIRGGAGNDVIKAFAPNLQVAGNAGDDHLSGEGIFLGDAGDDHFWNFGNRVSSAGTSLSGGAGIDTYHVVLNDTGAIGTLVRDFTAGEGGDIIDLSALFPKLVGFDPTQDPIATGHVRLVQSGVVTLLEVNTQGSAGGTWVTLLQLSNVTATNLVRSNFAPIHDSADGHTISGTAVADTIRGNDGDDVLNGLAGADVLFGGAGADSLYGGDGKDVLSDIGADASVDSYYGGADADSFRLAAGQITVIDRIEDFVTGAGGDILDMEDLLAGYPSIPTGPSADLFALGYLSLQQDGADVIVAIDADGWGGSAGWAPLVRLVGVDAGSFGAANFTRPSAFLDAAAVDVTGSVGRDEMYGFGGNDRLSGASGHDILTGHGGDDSLYGGAGDDVLYGGDGDDALSGSTGMDSLYGGQGIDSLSGGADNDALYGGAAADKLNGGDGDDLIVGGAGIDQLMGGAGADRFAFAAGDSGVGAGHRDLITDFQAGVDKIDLTGVGLTSGGLVTITTLNAQSQLVAIDITGDGAVDMEIQVNTAGNVLTLSDFVV